MLHKGHSRPRRAKRASCRRSRVVRIRSGDLDAGLALNRMDWASVESSRNRTPLCAQEMAPGLAIRWPPPTMLATDAEWCGSL